MSRRGVFYIDLQRQPLIFFLHALWKGWSNTEISAAESECHKAIFAHFLFAPYSSSVELPGLYRSIPNETFQNMLWDVSEQHQIRDLRICGSKSYEVFGRAVLYVLHAWPKRVIHTYDRVQCSGDGYIEGRRRRKRVFRYNSAAAASLNGSSAAVATAEQACIELASHLLLLLASLPTYSPKLLLLLLLLHASSIAFLYERKKETECKNKQRNTKHVEQFLARIIWT